MLDVVSISKIPGCIAHSSSPVNPYSLLLQGTAVGWSSGVCFLAGSPGSACGQEEGC